MSSLDNLTQSYVFNHYLCKILLNSDRELKFWCSFQNYRLVHPTASLTDPHGLTTTEELWILPTPSSEFSTAFPVFLHSSYLLKPWFLYLQDRPNALFSPSLSCSLLSILEQNQLVPNPRTFVLPVPSSKNTVPFTFTRLALSSWRPQFKYHLPRQAFPLYSNTNCHLVSCSCIIV